MSVLVFRKKDSRRKSSWCCRWVEYVDGQPRKREQHFRTRALADEKRALLQENMRRGRVNYSDAQAREIDHAVALCLDAGQPLLEVVQVGLDVLVAPGTRGEVPTIKWAVEAYLYDGEKRNLRPATLKGYRALLEPFTKGREDRLVDTVTPAEVMAYLVNKYSDETSRRNLRARLTGWWNFCAAKEQGWLPPLPARSLAWKAAEQDRRDPVIYTVEEAGKLLGAVPDYLRCGVAVGLFAGVRPKELLRMRWRMDDGGGRYGIDMDRRVIRLHASWTKKRRSRTLHDLPDNLWAWLERYRDCLPDNAAADAAERLVPIGEPRWYIQLRAAHKAAGIDKSRDGRPASDVMRHSFGSYGRHRGLEWAVEILGHDEGLGVFNRHYKESAASPEESARYFALFPE